VEGKSACGCVRKKESYCGPRCECSGCVNLPLSQEIQQGSGDEDCGSDVDAIDSNGSSSEEELETEVITDRSEFPDIVDGARSKLYSSYSTCMYIV